MEEDKKVGNVVNNFAEGSNCQVFNAPITGSIFAMPGSTVHQHVGEKGESKQGEQLSDEKLTKAIEETQEFFWGNSAYAVVYCVCRDDFGMAANMTAFERKVEELEYSKERSYRCTTGTLTNAFSNNAIYDFPVDKWESKGATKRVLKLRDEVRKRLKS